MWRWILVTGCFISLNMQAQVKWDGGANTENWNDALNWYPDGVPQAGDDILIDNSMLSGSFRVLLPPGTSTTSVRKLIIRPSSASITIELPSLNTANPGLLADSLVIHNQGIFINASGASAGSGISITTGMAIMDGGKYIHRSSRSNAGIIDKLSVIPETAKGIFEFDVPGTAGYTVSLTGNNFGSLHFRASAAGGTKSYSGSGSGTLTIRGDLFVDAGAQVTTTLTADILLGGDLVIDGKLNLNPSTSGTSARSLRFNGNALLRGNGQLAMNANFRKLLVEKQLTLQRNLGLPLANHVLRVKGSLHTSAFIIDGPGSFVLEDAATLTTGHPEGISLTANEGSIRTSTRSFGNGIFLFTGQSAQRTGDGLPDTVSAIGIQNPAGLSLTKMSYIRDSILLLEGRIFTAPLATLTLGSSIIRSGPSKYGGSGQGAETSFVEGPLGVRLRSGIRYILPLGRDTVFAPIALEKTDPGEETAFISLASLPSPDASPSPLIHWRNNSEYWQFSQPLSSSVRLAISLRPSSLPNIDQTAPVAAFFTGTWLPAAGSVQGEGYRWFTADSVLSGFSALSPALVQQAPLLPLRLLDFRARDNNDGILLEWDAEEDGADVRYSIMKSGDGVRFSEVTTVSSRGKQYASHQWKDVNPHPLTYYQLVMEARDRQWKSKVIRRSGAKGAARLYPNPAQEEINIFFLTPRSRYEVEIVSLSGTVCKKFVCNTAQCQVRVGDLRKGYYLIRIFDGSGLTILPFTKN